MLHRSRAFLGAVVCFVVLLLASACGVSVVGTEAAATDGGSPDVSTTPADGGAGDAGRTYSIGGQVSGLLGTGLVLENNGKDDLAITGAGAFTFSTAVASGSQYSVRVLTQPKSPAQSCTVTNGAGVATADVTTVQVTCGDPTYSVGGKVEGLLPGATIALQNKGGDTVTLSANGPFAFPTTLANGAGFGVTILMPPAGETCAVTNDTGSIAAGDVTSVVVTCTPNKYVVGGTVSGLSGSTTVVLQNNAGDNLTVSNGSFAFATPVASGSPYAVSVLTQPTGPSQTCIVGSGSGTVAASDVSNVTITCTVNTYVIGGNLIGINAGGSIVLQDNGGDDLPLSSDGIFFFATNVASGAGYNVTIKTQPAGQTCLLSSASGTVGSGDVSSVVVNCSNNYTVSGTVTGLNGTLVLHNGASSVTLTANDSFTFPTALTSGQTYNVTVFSAPATQACTVSNGVGTISGANVTNVTVTCATLQYTVGGTLSGLTGGSVTLKNNGTDTLTRSTTGGFTFAQALDAGTSYNVTVTTQPAGQTCVVTNGSGTSNTNVTNIQVTCSPITHTLGGSLSGLTGGTVVLQNGTDTLSLTANGSFTFAQGLANGTPYNVTVATQPTGKFCSVSNGTGTMGNSNISNVSVSCVTAYTVGGTTSGLAPSDKVVLQLNGANDLTVRGTGSFTFPTGLPKNTNYTVTVLTNPSGLTCTVANGSGKVTTSDVTNVTVTCQ